MYLSLQRLVSNSKGNYWQPVKIVQSLLEQLAGRFYAESRCLTLDIPSNIPNIIGKQGSHSIILEILSSSAFSAFKAACSCCSTSFLNNRFRINSILETGRSHSFTPKSSTPLTQFSVRPAVTYHDFFLFIASRIDCISSFAFSSTFGIPS